MDASFGGASVAIHSTQSEANSRGARMLRTWGLDPVAISGRVSMSLLGAREALSEAQGRDAWDEGSSMSAQQAIQYSLDEQDSAISARWDR